VELWIGVCALLLPFLLRGVEGLYVSLSQSWASSPTSQWPLLWSCPLRWVWARRSRR
jgi:hypothetical protein